MKQQISIAANDTNEIMRKKVDQKMIQKVDLSLWTVGAEPKLPLKMEHLSLGVEAMISPNQMPAIKSPAPFDDRRDEFEEVHSR